MAIISLVRAIKGKIPIKTGYCYDQWLKLRGWKLIGNSWHYRNDVMPHSHTSALKTQAELEAYRCLSELGWYPGQTCYPPGYWSQNPDGAMYCKEYAGKPLVFAIQLVGKEFVETDELAPTLSLVKE